MRIVILLVTLICSLPSWGKEPLRLAVASNFRPAMNALGAEFSSQYGYGLLISYGSTGLLFQQIRNGAKYQLFLSADRERPQALLHSGHARRLQHYADGRLALAWKGEPSINASNKPIELIQSQLNTAKRRSLAHAKASTAPYGLAARQLLDSLGAARQCCVEASNVAQAALLLDSGHVEFAIIAESLALQMAETAAQAGDNDFHWMAISTQRHQPIAQFAAALDDSQASDDFLAFLASPVAVALLQAHGYSTP